MMPHMYVRNHMAVPALDWYFLMRMGCGTGRRPTSVPCWRNFKISDSSVKPLRIPTTPNISNQKTNLSDERALIIAKGKYYV